VTRQIEELVGGPRFTGLQAMRGPKVFFCGRKLEQHHFEKTKRGVGFREAWIDGERTFEQPSRLWHCHGGVDVAIEDSDAQAIGQARQ
jgi:hypothetical protein